MSESTPTSDPSKQDQPEPVTAPAPPSPPEVPAPAGEGPVGGSGPTGASAFTPPSDGGGDSSDAPPYTPAGAAALASDRPEVAIGAAFAGGLVLATILKRLAR